MKKQLQKTIKENGFALILVECKVYSVEKEGIKEGYFYCFNDDGEEFTFTYDEIGRVE